MDKLLKLEKYQLLHNSIYWCGMIGIFILGFFTADTYVTEVMGPTEEIASSLADIFNGMVYDSTFLLIIMSAILALILGQEFSKRTINLEVSAGHSRKIKAKNIGNAHSVIMANRVSKTIVYVLSFQKSFSPI